MSIITDINGMREDVDYTLKKYYARILGLDFGAVPEFEAFPDKGYTGITKVSVKLDGTRIGSLYIAAFQAGDATGRNGAYELDDLTVPERYRFSSKSDKVVPRDKLEEGVVAEACIPILTAHDGAHHTNTACLESLTVDSDNNLVRGARLGLPVDLFNKKLLRRGFTVEPKIQLTTGYNAAGKRFGDPHAIHYGVEEVNQDAIQIVGFLSTDSPESPLIDIFSQYANMPPQEQQ